MKKASFLIICFFVFMGSFCLGYALHTSFINPSETVKVSAFLRVKNEIKTIEACLESIDGVFDRVVIIHSNEPDDGTVAIMRAWCAKRQTCEIYEYPFTVIPAHNDRYKTGNYRFENSLASYYNFGLGKFEPEEWVVKIDADQVYIKPRLKKMVQKVKQTNKYDERVYWGIQGYNTFPNKGQLVKYKPSPINGVAYDHFIIKRKYMSEFYHQNYYERLNYTPELKLRKMSGIYWFHFMKTLKTQWDLRPSDEAQPHEIELLTPLEKQEFEKYIRPLLHGTSPYETLQL